MQPTRTLQGFADRWAALRGRIERTAARCGRDASTIRVVAATKQIAAWRLREAVEAGFVDFGENRIQEARRKMDELSGLRPRLTWHLIGHIQSNKAKQGAESFDWIHSIDSTAIARELSRRAVAAGRTLSVLVEVNTSGESTKFGLRPERAVEMLGSLAGLPGLVPRGFMTVGPFATEAETTRRAFRTLAELLASARDAYPEWRLDQLSMGMSADFEIAIEEGATWIRIGTSLFGPRGTSEVAA